MADQPGEDSPAATERPVVLVVEDEADQAELFADWLAADYVVRVALTAEEALERFDEDVDVALLDRRMPDRSGDEVLTAIRERTDDCRVAMVTAVEPDVDVIDLGFDDYLHKPIEREELLEVVDRLVALAAYDRDLQEYYGLLSKRATLEAELPDEELEASEEYAALVERVERREVSVAARFEALSDTDYATLFRALRERRRPGE